MDLTSDYPFWIIRNGLIKTYPPLERDASCDVAVIGAGITGALISHRLPEHTARLLAHVRWCVGSQRRVLVIRFLHTFGKGRFWERNGIALA